jgi:hypothetical protein
MTNEKSGAGDDSGAALERHEINLETGTIAWTELERHFASGRLISVDPALDLVDVAQAFAADNTGALEQWLKDAKLGPVSDEEARDWHARTAWLWAVVVKPWVLVQDRPETPDN